MKRANLLGLIGFAIAGYIALVLIRGGKQNALRLFTLLGQETPFAKFALALIILQVSENIATGRARELLRTIGGISILTGIILSARGGNSPIDKFNAGLHEILTQ